MEVDEYGNMYLTYLSAPPDDPNFTLGNKKQRVSHRVFRSDSGRRSQSRFSVYERAYGRPRARPVKWLATSVKGSLGSVKEVTTMHAGLLENCAFRPRACGLPYQERQQNLWLLSTPALKVLTAGVKTYFFTKYRMNWTKKKKKPVKLVKNFETNTSEKR